MLLVNLFLPVFLQHFLYINFTVTAQIDSSQFPDEKLSEGKTKVLSEINKQAQEDIILKKCPHVDPYFE